MAAISKRDNLYFAAGNYRSEYKSLSIIDNFNNIPTLTQEYTMLEAESIALATTI